MFKLEFKEKFFCQNIRFRGLWFVYRSNLDAKNKAPPLLWNHILHNYVRCIEMFKLEYGCNFCVKIYIFEGHWVILCQIWGKSKRRPLFTTYILWWRHKYRNVQIGVRMQFWCRNIRFRGSRLSRFMISNLMQKISHASFYEVIFYMMT